MPLARSVDSKVLLPSQKAMIVPYEAVEAQSGKIQKFRLREMAKQALKAGRLTKLKPSKK